MTEQQKKKTVNVEDMQAFGRVIHNKGIGTSAVCSTAAATAAKQVVVGTTFSLTTGATCIITFQNAITVASATIAFGTAVDATAEDYASKNPAQEGWYVLSGGAFVLTEDTAPQSGTTYYTVTAAKPIYYRGAALAANMVKAGAQLILRYDGTNFNVIGDLDTDTDTVTDVTFDSSDNKLKQTKGGVQTDIVQLVTSGFRITTDETSGTDIFTAVGGATVTHDDTTGADVFSF